MYQQSGRENPLVLVERLLQEAFGILDGQTCQWAVEGLDLSSQNPVIQMLSLDSFSFLSAKLSSPPLALGQREVQGWTDSLPQVKWDANYKNSRVIFQGLVKIK